ncbi:hypothetical protein ACHAXA_007608 [Cyclostephanos tholiformis]|uniref:Uncharacterized protein n=1 Tax=Cyclostephanos tholiformis TaxID=382380 RepID=A0ABD3RF35_9STRA
MTKAYHGPPPPAELINVGSSLRLLSQGAEARVWLVTLTDPENNAANDNSYGGVGKLRSLHVGGGIHVPHLTSFAQRFNDECVTIEATSNNLQRAISQEISPSTVGRYTDKKPHQSRGEELNPLPEGGDSLS